MAKVTSNKKNKRLAIVGLPPQYPVLTESAPVSMTCEEYLEKFPNRRKKPQYAMASISSPIKEEPGLFRRIANRMLYRGWYSVRHLRAIFQR